MISDIPRPDRTLILEYADDIAISVTAETLAEAIRLIKIAIRRIERWALRNNLSLNPEKTKAMIFTKQRMPEDLPILTVMQ